MNENLNNEQLLVEQMQAGNELAFTQLYRFYSPRIYINIHQMVRDHSITEELVQELFTKIWQKRECIIIKESFVGYLYRCAQHIVLDHFRKISSNKKLVQKFKELAGENYVQENIRLEHKESADILKKAIDKLPPQQKKVYELVRLEGCTYKRAGEIMGISAHTVKEYLMLTRKSIKKYVLNYMEIFILLTMMSF